MFSKLLGRNRFKTESVVALTLLFNAFSWYLMSYLIIGEVVKSFGEASTLSFIFRFAYLFSVVVSAIFASFLASNINKVRLFFFWTLSGIMASFLLFTLFSVPFIAQLLITIFLGVSLGIGMPFLLSFFAKSTVIENRGKIGGLVFFATIVSASLFKMILSSLGQNLAILALAGWRGWSFLALYFAPRHVSKEEHRDRLQQSLVRLNGRTLFLYFVAWFMFAFVDGFGSNIVLLHGSGFLVSFKSIELVMISISALVGGALADRIGRKRVIIYGFVSLGVAYAFLGMAPDMWFSWLFYFIVDGLAVGSLWVLFTIVIWGEISERHIEKCYAFGEAPYFLAGIISMILTPVLLIPKTSAFSLAAFFLFLAVIPLMFAPETLPEKLIRRRELRSYIEKAKKIYKKYEKQKED